jgi:Mn2+/Fe2+ NRAMP family transporter
LALYAVSGITNVGTNELLLHYIPNAELSLNLIFPSLDVKHLLSFKVDKIAAVLGATIMGMVINFLGQKLWVFTEKDK